MQCCNDESKKCAGGGEGDCEAGMCCGEGTCASVESGSSDGYSWGLTPGKLVLLSVLSGGVYLIYWFFRNWRDIKVHTGAKISPTGRAVAACLPVVDIVLFCLLFKNIHSLTKKEGTRLFPLVWTCIGAALLIAAGWAAFVATFVTYGPDLFFLFY
ncbi:MAG: hypothetical protein AAB855_01125, partial [Patescibacteria group bacterium]